LTAFHSAAEHEIYESRRRIAVIAAHTASGDPTPPASGTQLLLAWLERVFPISFEWASSTDARKVDGALVLDAAGLPQAPADVPRLVLPARAQDRGEHSEITSVVTLAADGRLARALRGRAIPESTAAGEPPLPPDPGATVLASVAGEPRWWQAGAGPERLYLSAYPLAELREGETLRDHLRSGRFMGLLPLVHLLGEVLGEDGWKLPPPRASFVIDDPNLHWPSYGFLDYRELVTHASRHGYHLGLATVPLDGWRADRRAASLVRDNPTALSLLVHGNDHVARELARMDTDRKAEPAIAQGLRRIAALERRAGVPVARVMVPPFGACSEAALRAMFRLGFEAVCISRPYPWRDELPPPTPLAGWRPAELVAGGLPVLLRQHLAAPREDLAFRALLGQPLILYGHHEDFAEGLDLLAQAAADIDSLGAVEWGPLGRIAESGYATRRKGETLLVQMYARRVTLEVPDGVRTLRVLAQESLGGSAWQRVAYPGGIASVIFDDGQGASEPLSLDAPGKITLTLLADRPLNPEQVASRGAKPWPVVRRVLVEGRDRLRPRL
jgi:hypothetical protein